MERNLHEPEIYDFRQHDRLWQRVGPGLEPYPETTAEAMPRREELPPAQESQLPGAEPNPCCMGSEARELLAVLEGYIEEELEDRRALSGAVPAGTLVGEADPAGYGGGGERATPGGSWRPGISSPASPTGPIWCAACSARGVGRRNCGEATMRRRAAA